ncbi:hypothetical protein SVIO_002180 [Streptomyces violaceusniger]|uniref:Uncharacterized protein n=1 Tax=Streptomyces violaceusniger TaxID=68280 RepID=A0A4D4KKW3_STRVO|nr:hypothetical protein SVIO_002180 [Streptomyces violaceusniger]
MWSRCAAAAGGNRPHVGQPSQEQVQDPALQAVCQETVPEAGQYGVVEAGIGQLQAEQVLHIDPGPHRVRGLAVGEVLGELQDTDQSQPTRGDTGTPPDSEGFPELLVREQRAEGIPDPRGQAALGKRRLGHLALFRRGHPPPSPLA